MRVRVVGTGPSTTPTMRTPRECFVLETGSGKCVLHLDYAAVAKGEEVKVDTTSSLPAPGVDVTALTGASAARWCCCQLDGRAAGVA